ncbi:hypothetical protein PH552_31155 [Rhizobium sp. CNPSo 3968]|uniref:hypothetical protein n=1 Tax=Rhizobium sp. CNPSo 3968 TaxID=3021408 RepID=UPI002551A86F|nr:hypothetical protein [Rhizobium sp. CNPSo 3968]MDK4723813.1 hypothetical protein [Rhizobium sp. CNPSo 3968]
MAIPRPVGFVGLIVLAGRQQITTPCLPADVHLRLSTLRYYRLTQIAWASADHVAPAAIISAQRFTDRSKDDGHAVKSHGHSQLLLHFPQQEFGDDNERSNF